MTRETFSALTESFRQFLPLSLPWPLDARCTWASLIFIIFFIITFIRLNKGSDFGKSFELPLFIKVMFCCMSLVFLKIFNFWPDLLEFEAGWRSAAWGALAAGSFLLLSFNRPEGGGGAPKAWFFSFLTVWYLWGLFPGVSMACIIAASLIVIGTPLAVVWRISVLVSALVALLSLPVLLDLSVPVNITFSGVAPFAGVAVAWLLSFPPRKGFCRVSFKASAWLGIVLSLCVLFTTAHDEVKSAVSANQIGWNVMGTGASLKVWSTKEKGAQASAVVRRTFDEVNTALSSWDSKSELSQMNATAAEEPFACSPMLWDNLKMAQKIFELSDGAFDVTISPLMRLWGFRAKRSEEPSEKEIAEALEKVGFQHVVLDDEKKTVFFEKPGIGIDLGGIAKGYAVDLAVARLHAMGVLNAVVDLGGNLFCMGKPPVGEESLYEVGIRNPWDKSQVRRTVSLENRAVATSGNYERFVMYNGVRYPHIIDPRTGLPVHQADSVSVVCGSAFICDVLSTAIFVDGIENLNKYEKAFPGLSVCLLKKQDEREIEVSTGLFKEKPPY